MEDEGVDGVPEAEPTVADDGADVPEAEPTVADNGAEADVSEVEPTVVDNGLGRGGDGGGDGDQDHFQGKYPWIDEESIRAARLQKILDEAEAKVKDQPPLPPESSSVQFERVMEEYFIQTEKKVLEENSRLDYLLRMQKTLNETFNNAAWLHPHGQGDHDQCIIPECRHKGLEHFKMTIRRQNYIYLHQHPELDALMSVFIKRLLKTQPRDAVKFASEFFTFRRMAPDDLHRLVNEELLKLKQYQNPKGWKKGQGRGQGLDLMGDPDDLDLKDVNEVKILSLGPMAQPFGFTPPPTPEKIRPKKVKKVTPKPHVYCGCKDPGRRKSQPVPADPKPVKLEPCVAHPTH